MPFPIVSNFDTLPLVQSSVLGISELIAEYYNEDEVELTEDEDYKVEIEDYQYTTTAY